MSMICWVLGLSSAQIGALRATPSLTSDLTRVAEHEEARAQRDEMTKRMSPEQRSAAEARRRGFEATPAAREALARIAEARARLAGIGPFESALDLEKSWHMLHYLFTGHVDDSNAPGNALLTGESIGDDVGYGPARLHDETATREFGRFLETLDVARLQARVNLREMTRLRVYAMPMGPGSDAEYESELRAEVGHYFPLLREYVSRMSERRHGLLTWVS
jgi:Domain of unknown function (DUF1877)